MAAVAKWWLLLIELDLSYLCVCVCVCVCVHACQGLTLTLLTSLPTSKFPQSHKPGEVTPTDAFTICT